MLRRPILEEYQLDWCGWARTTLKLPVEWTDFYVVNALVIVIGFIAAHLAASAPMLALAFPALMLINATFFHVAPFLRSKGRFSPGLISAVVLFYPVSIAAYGRAAADGALDSETLVGSLVIGAALMACPHRPLGDQGPAAFSPAVMGGLTDTGTTAVVAGLVPAIPIGRAPSASDRDPRHKAGDDGGAISVSMAMKIPRRAEAAMAWFLHNWMYGGVIAGLFLLAVAPLLADAMSPALVAVYLQLPLYMLHQLEEHADDRFRRFANAVMAGGREALTTPDVVVINVVGVWIVDLLALYGARYVHLGFGLIAVDLTLVNAVVHIVGAVVLRRYNPGLVTGIVLFLPVGLAGLWLMSAAPDVTAADHILGLGVAIVLHAAIIIHVKRRVAMLAGAA